MSSLDSFSTPAGILTAFNTGVIVIGGGILLSNSISEMKSIHADIKKYALEIEKIKALSKELDPSFTPKISQIANELVASMNNISRKVNTYIAMNEEKNAARDKKLNEIYEYIKKMPNAPVFEKSLPKSRPESEDDEDSDVATIVRMASAK